MIGVDGSQLGIVSASEALDLAFQQDLDLVKIALCSRYTLIIDEMEDDYIKNMIDDGIISLDDNRILVLDREDRIESGFIQKDGTTYKPDKSEEDN